MDNIETIISEIGKVCFMPLTFGGGIRTENDAVVRIRSGADKIIVNHLLHEDKRTLKHIISKLGSQAVVASIDYKMIDNIPVVFKENGTVRTKSSLFEFASKMEQIGVGEIFTQNIDLDGRASGYDIEVLERIVENVSVPIIACSGAGKNKHFVEASKIEKLSAIAAGNYFNFKELSYPLVKIELKKHNIDVR